VTQADIRALNLSRLALSETDTAWDIGAGSGAMSIEMSELAWRGQIFTIECNPENLDYIRENVASFGALNVQVIKGYAPAVLEGLPRPSAVFIGGTGGALEAILRHIDRVAPNGCRVVMNLATLENLHAATAVMQALDWLPKVTQVNVAHGRSLPQNASSTQQGESRPTRTHLVPLNPMFILTGTVK
jgi:precorrin-6Y C5,15-methyltransferase (decarboxylating)